MKIPYNILIQIKMSVRPYFKGFTLIFFFYNCRKQVFIHPLDVFCFIFVSHLPLAQMLCKQRFLRAFSDLSLFIFPL